MEQRGRQLGLRAAGPKVGWGGPCWERGLPGAVAAYREEEQGEAAWRTPPVRTGTEDAAFLKPPS